MMIFTIENEKKILSILILKSTRLTNVLSFLGAAKRDVTQFTSLRVFFFLHQR